MKRIFRTQLIGLIFIAALGFFLCSCESPAQQDTYSIEIQPPDTSAAETFAIGEKASTSAFAMNDFHEDHINITLKSCRSSASIFPEAKMEELFYDEDYNRENERFTVDENGILSEEYRFVILELEYNNSSDYDLKIDLSRMYVVKTGAEPSIYSADSVIWVKDRSPYAKDRYMPVVAAKTTANYTIGVISRVEDIESDEPLLVFDYDRIDLETKNLKAFDLSNI